MRGITLKPALDYFNWIWNTLIRRQMKSVITNFLSKSIDNILYWNIPLKDFFPVTLVL